MNTGTITAVGIDVSKHKSMVAARRPGGEVVLLPFDVEHTAEGLKKLITKLRQLDGEIRIIMEHTGMYWRPIAMTLKEAGFYVSVVNAILIHNFSDNSIRKVKTDRADAMKIANYGLTFWIDLQEYAGEDENRQLLKIQSRLYERTATTAGMLRNGPVDKSAIGYSMELRPMALRVLRRLTPGCFRVVRSFTIRFRFNAVAERRQCS